MSVEDVTPIFLTDRQAAALLGVGLTSFRGRVRTQEIPSPVKMGRRSLWPRVEIESFAAALVEKRNARTAGR